MRKTYIVIEIIKILSINLQIIKREKYFTKRLMKLAEFGELGTMSK